MKVPLLLTLTLLITACRKPDYKKILHDPTLYSHTVNELNKVITENSGELAASRCYAYASIAGYEAIAAGFPDKYKSLVGQLNGFKNVAKPNAGEQIDYEYASLFAFCNAGEAITSQDGSLKYYTDSLRRIALQHGMPAEMIRSSESYAKAIALSVFAWSKGDNYLKAVNSEKNNSNAARESDKTRLPYSEAQKISWGQIRKMVMSYSNQHLPPPPAFDIKNKESLYYKEVVALKNAGDHLTKEQAQIADFWNDNSQKLKIKNFSSTAHWLSIAGIGAKKTKADFETTVYVYAETSVALFDGLVETDADKYLYQSVNNPETVIDKYINTAWHAHLKTSQSTEYPCGPCVISMAASEVLTSVFRNNLAFTDTSETKYNIKSRFYKSFNDASNEASLSRFYGGVSFRNSCIVSNQVGTEIGDSVMKKLVMKR